MYSKNPSWVGFPAAEKQPNLENLSLNYVYSLPWANLKIKRGQTRSGFEGRSCEALIWSRQSMEAALPGQS